MNCLHNPAASWDAGAYMWGIGEIPERVALYDFGVEINVFTLQRGWQSIEDAYNRSFPS